MSELINRARIEKELGLGQDSNYIEPHEIDSGAAQALFKAGKYEKGKGFSTNELANMTKEELDAIPGIGPVRIGHIQEAINAKRNR